MTRYHKALSVFLVTVFGLWGCSRGPETNSNDVNNEKIKALEAKTGRLEEDLRKLLAVKDQMRKQLTEAEETQTVMNREIERLLLVEKDRDNLKVNLGTRTAERDQLQIQYEAFRSNLKELLGQAEAAAQRTQPNVGLVSRDKASIETNRR